MEFNNLFCVKFEDMRIYLRVGTLTWNSTFTIVRLSFALLISVSDWSQHLCPIISEQ